MPHGVHNTPVMGFRLPADLQDRLRDTADRVGETLTDIAARGIESELNRLDSIIHGTEADSDEH